MGVLAVIMSNRRADVPSHWLYNSTNFETWVVIERSGYGTGNIF